MIHSTAIVSPRATIGDNVEIGAFSIVHDNVYVGEGTKIGSYCEIGLVTELAKTNVLKIGPDSNIRSHAVIYIGSDIGEGLNTGHYVTIRENSDIGEFCQIGSRGDIQGDCQIGRYTKMHADVHVGKRSNIGSYVWLFPEVLLTNDPTPPSEDLVGVTIEDYVVVASKVLIFPGVRISEYAVISAGSVVKSDIPEGKLAQGIPAKAICNANIMRMHNDVKGKSVSMEI